jgi:putative spermidine/putrescine transport system substrate-binding protein/spermidine/putrescine transport system substrate-binding protein
MSDVDGQQTRRDFLRRSGLAAVAVVGGKSVFSAGGASAAITRERSRAAGASTTLRFVGWQGYDGTPASTFPILTGWEQQNGVSLSTAYIDTNEDIITKLQASPPGSYDLVTPYHGTLPAMIQAGLLEPINTGALKNWPKVLNRLRSQHYLHDSAGSVYAVPLGFGYIQVQLYNPSLIKTPPTSYADVLKPAFKGKFTLKDAPETFFWIAKVLGYGHPDPHHITHAELKNCIAYARKVLKAAKTLSTSYGDIFQLLVTKEVAFTLSATPDEVGRAAAQGVTLKQFYPKEGAQSYVDNYAIPKGSPNAAAALSFIDEMISPKINAELAAVYGGGLSDLYGVQYLTPSLRDYYPYAHIARFFSKLAPLYPPIPVTSTKYATYSDWTNAWQQAKAG